MGLKVNEDETKIIRFGEKAKNYKIKIGQYRFEKVEESK